MNEGGIFFVSHALLLSLLLCVIQTCSSTCFPFFDFDFVKSLCRLVAMVTAVTLQQSMVRVNLHTEAGVRSRLNTIVQCLSGGTVVSGRVIGLGSVSDRG